MEIVVFIINIMHYFGVSIQVTQESEIFEHWSVYMFISNI